MVGPDGVLGVRIGVLIGFAVGAAPARCCSRQGRSGASGTLGSGGASSLLIAVLCPVHRCNGNGTRVAV